MELLPSRLVQQTLRMSGSGHSYLKQLCLPEAALLREDLGSRLDPLPPVLQDRYSEMLVSLDNRKFFQAFAEMSVLGSLQEAGWSVRELEEKARAAHEAAPSRRPAPRNGHAVATDPNVAQLEQELGEKLGARVRIQSGRGGRGKLVIEYYSLDELDGIIERIR